MRFQDVQGEGVFRVCGIEEYNIVDPPFGNSAEYRIYQVAVRIEEPDAVAGGNVLQNHVQQQRGLAGARAAHHVHVPHPLLGAQRHGRLLALVDVFAEDHLVALGDGGSGLGFLHLPHELFRPHRL